MINENGKKIACPYCNSTHIHKDGYSHKSGKRIQKYLCNKCWRNTVKPKVLKDNK